MEHGLVSLFSTRVVWTLKLKGISYEQTEENLFNKSPELLKYNPVHKKVPVLVHAGKPICESIIIVEYIDEIWPQNPLLPADPYERSLARFWVKYAEDKGSSLWALFRSSSGEELVKALKKEVPEFLKVVEDQCLSDENKFFGGDTINIVDIAFGAIVHWLQFFEEAMKVKFLEVEEFPRMLSWITDFKNVPAINENLPDGDKMLALFNRILGKPSSSSESDTAFA